VANTWEVRRWRYVISYLRSLPIFFSLIRFWRRAPRHLQGQVQLLGVSKDISTTLEFSKNISPLSVFSKNNSPRSVVCKEYLRCSACSKNITPPPFFQCMAKYSHISLFLDEKELCLDRYLMLLLTINCYSQRNVSLWSAIFSFSKRWRLEKRWHQKSRRSENRNRGDPNSIKEFPVLLAVQRAGVAKCEAVTSWKFRAFSF